MDDTPKTGISIEQPSLPGRTATIGWALLAIAAQVALVDAAIETFRGGSPIRWWVAAPVLAFVALSVWLWRPGGTTAKRWGWSGAASSSIGGLLVMLAVTAWLPDGQVNGVRMALQPTSTVLTAAIALAVLLAAYVLVRGLVFLPKTARLVARSVVILLAIYALAALGVAIRDQATFASLFQGEAVWQRLPRWLQGTFVGALGLLPLGIVAQIARFAETLRRQQPVRLLIHQATALVMALVMAFGGMSLPVELARQSQTSAAGSVSLADILRAPAEPIAPRTSAAGQPTARDQAAGPLARLFDGLVAAQEAAPKDTFDPKAVVATVGGDPIRLAGWVRDNTYWVPYRGALRGGVGVLMDRLGNSVDRALLLATLLQTAGQTVRLARARLTEDDGRRLLAAGRPVPPGGPASPAGAAERLERDIDQHSAQLGIDVAGIRRFVQENRAAAQRAQEELAARATAQTGALLTALAASPARDRSRSESAAAARVLDAVRDHWWVQRRDGNAWVDLDVMLPDGQPVQTVARATETIPSDARSGSFTLAARDCQEVTIRIIVEQSKGGKLVEKTPLTKVFRPMDVVGETVTLIHVPLKWPASLNTFTARERMADFEAAAVRQAEWLPALSVGRRMLTGRTFTDTGDLRDKPGGGAAGGVGASFGDLFGGGALAGEVDRGGVLAAEWLEYEIRIPGDAPRKIRRQVFDLIGPAARLANRAVSSIDASVRRQRAFVLTGGTEILLQASAIPSAYLDDRMCAAVLANRHILTQMVTKRETFDAGALDHAVPLPGPLLSLAHLRFSAVPQPTFLASVNILSRHVAVLPAADGRFVARQVIDIAANDVAVWQPPASSAFGSRVRQGVVDTIAEAAILPGPGGAGRNVSELMRHAGASRRLAVADAGTLANPPQSIPPDVRARLAADVAAGALVVVPFPTARPAAPAAWAWWRVDLESGTTLGIDEQGRGGAAQGEAEYVELTAFETLAFRVLISEVMWGYCMFSSLLPNLIGDVPMAPGWKVMVKCVGVGVAAFFAADMLAITWQKLLAGLIASIVTGSTA